MSYTLSGTMTIGSAFINMTVGAVGTLISVRHLDITGIYYLRLRRVDERTVYESGTVDGSGNPINQQPTMFYVTSGSLAIFENPPDIAYPFALSYYTRLPLLSGSNTTNFLTNDHPRLLRTACMLIATEFEKEVGQGQYDRTYWQMQFDKQLAEVQAMSDADSFPYDNEAAFA
jgi:hypothetical protein